MTGADGSFTPEHWRELLVARGFSDNGVHLRGPVTWSDPTSGPATARVEVEPDDRFPFAPPHVRILDPGRVLDLTFHLERPVEPGTAGNLCLWEEDWPVDCAPWLDPDTLLRRVAGWLERTAAGWPDDDACDLERYLPNDLSVLVLYDAEALAGLDQTAVRTAPGPTRSSIVITDTTRRVPEPRDRRRSSRKDRALTWLDDLGPVRAPIRAWSDIEAALGARADRLARDIRLGVIDLLLLRYQRGSRSSVLAIAVRPGAGAADITLTARESADTSRATRLLRAGAHAGDLATAKIAIVGCGAVGSFAADLLFRSGVRRLALLDGERLRPGNLVRHLAGAAHVGRFKVEAVLACLAALDDDARQVYADPRQLRTLTEAMALVSEHDVVLDATASARASSLLATAAAVVGPRTGHVVVSVCVQREGDVVRVDRLPSRGGETYLPELSHQDDAKQPYERGCGSPISRTPPGAVVSAAELACRFVVDEALRECSLPATVVDVRRPQAEPPFDTLGTVHSRPPAEGGTAA